MKSFVKKTLFIALLPSMLGTLGSCSKGTGKVSSTGETKKEDVKFVAVTDTEWDAVVTVGKHKYQFSIDLKEDKTLNFAATCTGKQENQGGGSGPRMAAGQEGEATSEEEETDFTKYNFSFGGTYEIEEGYGYKLNFLDASKTVIHTDYDSIQRRHQFYYNVTTEEGSSVALFQYKDTSFSSKLAANYKTWDERDSDYIFIGEATGNNNSVALAYIYAHKDKSVVINTPKDAGRQVTLGLTWKMDGNSFVLMENGRETKADMALNGKGFRLGYNSNTFFCSTDASVGSQTMTNEMFDGKTIYEFAGSYTTSGPDGGTKNVSLKLTDNQNKMFLYSEKTLSKTGTYTFQDEKFTLNFEGEEPVEVQKNEEGKYVYSFQMEVRSFFGTSQVDVVLTYTPTGA